MTKFFTCSAIGLLIAFSLIADVHAQQIDTAYRKVATERAVKIVDALNLNSKSKKNKVVEIIADQYVHLNQLQSIRDGDLKAAGNDTAAKTAVKQKATKSTDSLHAVFLKELSGQLNASQVDVVKNGITYNTVPLTYANYLLMLPYLEQVQQEKIMAFLLEGREHAMDGGSADEKHAWFNKYKGKIAIYLTSLGYNLKKEGEEWAKRRDTASKALEITQAAMVMQALNLDTTNKLHNESVRNLLALQYQKIIAFNAEWDLKLKHLKDSVGLSKDSIAKGEQEAWLVMKDKLDKQRMAFENKLTGFLNAEQVELVKNSMTNNGYQKEYDKFMALLPGLKEEEKQQVKTYLLEARENAMNVLTSREINQWFAKYRGRTNNYLAARGYNLRKATEELERKTGEAK